MGVVILHFIEHLAQVYQLYILHWSRAESIGLLSLKFPWLMHSELLHYAFALYMLYSMIALRPKVCNKQGWELAITLQKYHHLEHFILLGQFLFGVPMADRVSLGSWLLPRLELHFVYNLMVLIPMLLSLRGSNYGKVY